MVSATVEHNKKKEESMIPQIKKILYSTDLSKNAAYAFFYAVDIANKYNASIVILHTVEPIPHVYSEGGTGVLRSIEKKQQESDIEDIKKRVHDLCKKIESKTGFSCTDLVSKILVPLGYPVEEILKAADDEACDAIILGTHGKGFLRQTFLGSVSVSVLERTRKPVFIIPLPSEKSNIDWDNM
jgi:nucleotide-binding universal stress UspA family protein